MVKLAKKPRGSSHPLQPSKGGRPPVVKATPELIEAACNDIRLGLTIEGALALQGISRVSVDRWRKINPAVNLAFERAEHEFEKDLLAKLQRHSDKDQKAATWLLERRSRGQWLPAPTKTELTGKDGGPIQALTLSKVLLSSVAQAVDAPKPMKQAIPA